MNKRQRKKYIMRALSKAYDRSVENRHEGSVFIATQKQLITGQKILVVGVTESVNVEFKPFETVGISIEGYGTELTPF